MSLQRPASLAQLGRWIGAFTLVAGAHAAALAIAMREPEPPAEAEPTGAFLVELAPIAATAPAPSFELPPGPPSTDSIETPAVMPSAKMEEPPPEPELPPLPTLATAPPEIAAPKPVETTPKKPHEETVERQPPAPAQAANVAAKAAAPPRIEDAIVAERPAAPAAGVSERDRKIKAQWQGALSAHLVRHARFPAAVRDHALDRQVLVRFSLDRQGRVISVEIAESSGSDLLDAEAEAMVRRASPLPVPPEQVTSDALDLVVPVRFKARR